MFYEVTGAPVRAEFVTAGALFISLFLYRAGAPQRRLLSALQLTTLVASAYIQWSAGGLVASGANIVWGLGAPILSVVILRGQGVAR